MSNVTKTEAEEINTKVGDIISSLKEILSGRKSVESENSINQRLEKIYEAEKETGGTDYIAKLEVDIEKHNISEKKKARTRTKKMLTEKSISSKEVIISGQEISEESKESMDKSLDR